MGFLVEVFSWEDCADLAAAGAGRMRRGGVGGGGKGFNDGREDGGKGIGGYNLGMVDADMWVCRQCSTHSFLSRRQ